MANNKKAIGLKIDSPITKIYQQQSDLHEVADGVVKYVIPLDPITKKNHQQIFRNKKTGKPFITPSEQYKAYEAAAVWYLRPAPKTPISDRVNVKCHFYLKTKRNNDINNLLEAITDVMVKAKIITDDNHKIVAGHDGTRVFYDKDNPRTEIFIERMAD